MSNVSILEDFNDLSLKNSLNISHVNKHDSIDPADLIEQTDSDSNSISKIKAQELLPQINNLKKRSSLPHNINSSNHTNGKLPFLSTAKRAEIRLSLVESPSIKDPNRNRNSPISPITKSISNSNSPKNSPRSNSVKKVNQTPKRFISNPINPNASYLKATSSSLNRVKDIGKETTVDHSKIATLLSTESRSLIHSKFKASNVKKNVNKLSIEPDLKLNSSKFQSQPPTPNIQKDMHTKLVSNSAISTVDRKKINRRSLNFTDSTSTYQRKKSLAIAPTTHTPQTAQDKLPRSKTFQNFRNPVVPPKFKKVERDKLTTPPIQTTRSVEKINDSEKMYECLLSHQSTSEIVHSWNSANLDVDHDFTPVSKTPIEIIDVPNNLNIYEKGEILRKSEVFFTGLSHDVKPSIDISNFNKNFGFDDNDKNYNAIVGDHIDYRYEILGFLGSGSFGNVVRCKDYKYNKVVAVKIIKNDMTWSLQAAYEIKMLKLLFKERYSKLRTVEMTELRKRQDEREENLILKYFNHFHFRGHMCITTELLSINLYQVIESTNFKGFSINIIKEWSTQILEGLKFIHNRGIIHCDLKPENIMLIKPNELNIKIIDFGSACFNKEISYSYIQSRFYRAPEVLLGARYNEKIDIWSFGCLIIELFTGDPIFPGGNELEQIGLILEIFGSPISKHILHLRNELHIKGPVDSSENAIRNLKKNLLFNLFDSMGKLKLDYLNSKIKKRIRPNSKKIEILLKSRGLHKEDYKFIDFVTKILNWDFEKRPACEELLGHTFLKKRDHTAPISSSRITTPIPRHDLVQAMTPIRVEKHAGVNDTISDEIDNSHINENDEDYDINTPKSNQSSISDNSISLHLDKA